jgi:hypothetical protein
MSSNSEWQNQYTKQRIGDAHRMAAQHRAAKEAHRTTARRPGLLSALLTSIGRLFTRPQGETVQPLPPVKTDRPAGEPR